MKNLLKISLLICAILFGGKTFSQTVSPDFVDGKISFKFVDSYEIFFTVQKDKDSTVFISEFPFLKEMALRYGIKKVRRPYVIGNSPKMQRTIYVTFDSIHRIDAFVKELQCFNFIEYVEKDPIYHDFSEPNDPYYGTIDGKNRKWHLDVINASKAWQIQKGNSNIKVAVVDNFVWGEHEDLRIPSSLQYNAINRTVGSSAPPAVPQDTCSRVDSCPAFKFSHGTHVAGLVGAINNNGVGVASIGGGVTLMGIRAADNNGIFGGESTVAGVKWASDNGANVINMSFGGVGENRNMKNALEACYNEGIICIASAGNTSDSAKLYPASYAPYVISVASTNYSKAISSFSTYGSWVDIAGPGGYYNASDATTAVLSSTYSKSITVKGQGFDGKYYDVMQGTSMAAPVVSGLVGLMLSKNPNLKTDSIRAILQRTSQTILKSDKYINSKGGLIDAFAALEEVSSITPSFVINNAPIQGYAPLTVKYQNTSSSSFSTIKDVRWTFEGGNPSSSTNMDTVTVTYDSPGMYSTSIWVKDSIGSSDSLRKPYFINVYYPGTPECITQTNIRTSDTLALYTLADCGEDTGSEWGYISGHNSKKDSIFVEYFKNEGQKGISSVSFSVGEIISLDPDASITVHIYSSTPDKKPDIILVSQKVSYSHLLSATNVTIDFNPVVGVSGDYFVGYEISYHNALDTFALYTSTGKGNPERVDSNATAMVYRAGNWIKLKDECSNLPLSLGISANNCTNPTGISVLECKEKAVLLDSIQTTVTTVVNSNREWFLTRVNETGRVDSNYKWISIQPCHNIGNGVLTISAEENLYHKTRSATYAVYTNDGLSDTLKVTQKAAPLILDLNVDNIEITAGTKISGFQIMSTIEWEITLSNPSASEWISFSQTEGVGNQGITVSTTEYRELDKNRSVDIIVKAKNYELQSKIVFTQKGSTFRFVIEPNSLTFSPDVLESQSVYVTNNYGDWAMDTPAEWLDVDKTSGNGDGRITIVPKTENTGNERIDTLRINSNNQYRDLIVMQKGIVSILPTVTNVDFVSIYPNPTHTVIFVESKNIQVNHMRLLDFTGKMVQELSSPIAIGDKIKMDIAHLPAGAYFLNIYTSNGQVIFSKIIKQ